MNMIIKTMKLTKRYNKESYEVHFVKFDVQYYLD